MSNPQSTAFVLVPGAFGITKLYEKVTPLLKNRGFDVHPIALPSMGERDSFKGPATFQEDASYIHSKLLQLVEQGKDVVLAMNSYGGFPGTEATKGLSKGEREREREREREKEGKEGGVVALVYLASFIAPVGMSLRKSMGEGLPDSVKNAGDYMTLNYDEDWKNIFSDMPEDEAKYYMSLMPNHSTISFSGELTHPGYKYIPVTYLLTEGDKIIPVEAQRKMIEFARGEGVDIKVVETSAGHCPMLSIPEKTVDVLIAAASELNESVSLAPTGHELNGFCSRINILGLIHHHYVSNPATYVTEDTYQIHRARQDNDIRGEFGRQASSSKTGTGSLEMIPLPRLTAACVDLISYP
ncbi:Alpha/beta hydrolase family-domain-containing protein [Cadophora sp. MPI-SDFR-AT-0126]|nr:Alpha/beta hydrolase family-domain-containing protein [Leotiomycetes sp. MPI-SDFR-AT-0126]